MRDKKQELLDELDLLLGEDEVSRLEDIEGINDLDQYLEEDLPASRETVMEDDKNMDEESSTEKIIQEEVVDELIHVEDRDVSYVDTSENDLGFDSEIIDLDEEYATDETSHKRVLNFNNKNYWIYGGILGVLIIVLIVVLASGVGSDSSPIVRRFVKSKSAPDDQTESSTENTNPLQMNEFEDVKTLVQTYYKAMTDCDMDTLSEVVDDTSGISKEILEKRKEYIESYDAIETYVKNGMEDNTYVVWVYYETKFVNIDTSAPGSSVLYVKRNPEDNSVYICNGSKDEKIIEYMNQLMKDQDVVDFNKNVNLKLEQACAKDQDLEQFVARINGEEDTTQASEE